MPFLTKLSRLIHALQRPGVRICPEVIPDDLTHFQYLARAGSNSCPPVHFCNAGRAVLAGEPGSTPALLMTRASHVMMWSGSNQIQLGTPLNPQVGTDNQPRMVVHRPRMDLGSC